MIAFDEALGRLLALAQALPVERLAVMRAVGRTLVEPLAALRTQPPFVASAMDGYAIRAADLPGPWIVTGEAAAGAAPGLRLGQGEAARIFTGAPLPEGADVVLIQEDAAREGGTLRLAGPRPAPGENVRAAGGDFRAGDGLVAAGVPLTPAQLGLAASGGHGALTVRRRPMVALLATGDELAPPGEEPGPGGIAESIRPALAALLSPLADVRDLGIARDDSGALNDAIARARGADVLVTVGGASVGDRDLVRPALAAAGGDITFWKVAIRPGKPMLAGRLGAAVVLGLPGNPASAFVTAQLFLLPVVRRLAGWAEPGPVFGHARLTAALPANGARRDHLRGALGWDGTVRTVTPHARQDSSLQSVLARSDALIVREVGAGPAQAGDVTEVLDMTNRHT